MQKKVLAAVFCSLVGISGLLVTGCATIVGRSDQLISLNSQPSSATVTITDEKGTAVMTGTTPTTVTLKKSDGSWFGGKTYLVKVAKEGYETQTIQINHQPNGWYIAGNLIFGGLIGWFIVDPLSGAMYNLTPDQINPSLTPLKTSENKAEGQTLTIALLQDVPPELRSKMTRIK
jgi:hypothetical protein